MHAVCGTGRARGGVVVVRPHLQCDLLLRLAPHPAQHPPRRHSTRRLRRRAEPPASWARRRTSCSGSTIWTTARLVRRWLGGLMS